MARNVEVKMHVNGINDVFKQPGVVGKLEDMGEAIAESAHEKTQALYPKNGFTNKHFGARRYKTTHGTVGVSVGAQTPLGNRAQAEHSVLTQAMDAGRG